MDSFKIAAEAEQLTKLLKAEGFNISPLAERFLSLEAMLFEVEDHCEEFEAWKKEKEISSEYFSGQLGRGAVPLLVEDGEIILFAVCSHRQDTGELRSVNDVYMVVDGMLDVLQETSHEAGPELVMIPFDQFREIVANNLLYSKTSRDKFLQGINQDTTAEEGLFSALRAAIEKGASDIHLEPDPNLERGNSRKSKLAAARPNWGRIRFRINGVLYDGEYLIAEDMIRRMVAVIKGAANMNLAEHRLPQDGRLSFNDELLKKYPFLAGYECRVSLVPTVFGESAVLRLQNTHGGEVNLKDINLPPEIEGPLCRMICEPHGLVFVTGPTGSGKTTTLYAILRAINDGTRKILTVENPVEVRIGGITQVETNSAIGLDFAAALRSFLRQDPDVIMVGEIRDAETALTAMHAAITGHMVFATLHVDESLEALARLRGLGVADIDISAGLKAVLSQRLIRRLCPKCFQLEAEGRYRINRVLGVQDLIDWNFVIRKANLDGCSDCNHTGYVKRMILPEFWILHESERRMISEGVKGLQQFLEEAIKHHGFTPMSYRAIMEVLKNRTSLEEVLRVAVTGDQLVRNGKLIAKAINGSREKIQKLMAGTAEHCDHPEEPDEHEEGLS
jgi:type II secretory ATPase GspE/PulE/Tfp pilus assembly ATPase PilB-like protein